MTRTLGPMEKLAIWGAGGHAKVVADIVRREGRFTLLGFLDDQNPERQGERFDDSLVIGGADQLEALLNDDAMILFGFGDGRMRLMLAARILMMGFRSPSAVHPSAVIAGSCSIGEGTVIAAGSVINPYAKLGRHVIINTGATVDHDCIIGDGASVAPGVHLAGKVSVGKATTLGIGTVARENIAIGSDCVIGAGSVVVSDIPDGVLAYGSPAKVIRML